MKDLFIFYIASVTCSLALEQYNLRFSEMRRRSQAKKERNRQFQSWLVFLKALPCVCWAGLLHAIE